MNLQEAAQSGQATKHVDEPYAGTHMVSKANFSAGYYHDFRHDDRSQQSPFSTSFYWGPNDLPKIASFAGNEGWEPQKKREQA